MFYFRLSHPAQYLSAVSDGFGTGHTGSLAEVLHFIVKYESAEWQEVSRQLVLKNIEIPDVSHAWVSSLQWYAKLIAMNE